MSHSPEMQLYLLFSGSREVLNDKKDVEDCIRILLLALSKIPSKSSYLI